MCRFKKISAVSAGIGKSFNTSYVSVQVRRFKRWHRPYVVSIHPMCRFKFSKLKICFSVSAFQYILCVGSRSFKEALIYCVDISFNTSYVSVQVKRKNTTEL